MMWASSGGSVSFMNDTNIASLVSTLAQLAIERGWSLTTAESCTGGLIAGAITELAGSSAWFDRSFITYSNNAKHEMLAVPEILLVEHGAVSEEVVLAMARGALSHSDANLAVSVSGVAGPTGGTAQKPVGTVWIACAWISGAEKSINTVAHGYLFDGDRASVREQTVVKALHQMMRCIEDEPNVSAS